MSPRTSKIIRWTVSVVLLVLVLSLANWGQVWKVLRDVEPRWIAIAFGVVLLDRLATNQRWHILLEARGVRTGFWSLLQIQFAANFLGSFLPSSVGTDAIRMAALCRKGAPAPAVIAATLVDRISLAIATLLLGAGMLLLFAHRFVPDELAEMVLGVTGLVLVCGLMCLHKSVRTWIRLKLLPYVPSRFQKTLHEVADAALTYRHEYRAMVQLALVTILVFAIRIYFVWVLASAVGLDLSLLKLTIVIPILWLIVMLPITIGGIGVQDAGYVALMAFIGVPAALAVSISLLEHVIVRIVSLPGAFFVGNMAIKGGSPAMADSSAKAG